MALGIVTFGPIDTIFTVTAILLILGASMLGDRSVKRRNNWRMQIKRGLLSLPNSFGWMRDFLVCISDITRIFIEGIKRIYDKRVFMSRNFCLISSEWSAIWI